MMRIFGEEESLRYDRQFRLTEIGHAGQQKLQQARVLVVGAGGLGSPVLMYLAAAGVGTIGIVDGDDVDLSNLQRQIIHSSADVNIAKVDSAAETIEKLNPHVQVIKHHEFLTESNAASIIQGYDFIIEATDKNYVKYLVNDTCVAFGKSFCIAGIFRWGGQILTHTPESACYRCLFAEMVEAPSAKEVGVLGMVAGIAGTIQAAEAVKYIVGTGELLINRVLMFDVLEMTFDQINLKPSATCATCGTEK